MPPPTRERGRSCGPGRTDGVGRRTTARPGKAGDYDCLCSVVTVCFEAGTPCPGAWAGSSFTGCALAWGGGSSSASVDFLKFRMPLPSASPSWGSLVGPKMSSATARMRRISPKPSLMGARIAPRDPRGYRDVVPGPWGRKLLELLGPGLEQRQEGIGREDPGEHEAAHPAGHGAPPPAAFGGVGL